MILLVGKVINKNCLYNYDEAKGRLQVRGYNCPAVASCMS